MPVTDIYRELVQRRLPNFFLILAAHHRGVVCDSRRFSGAGQQRRWLVGDPDVIDGF